MANGNETTTKFKVDISELKKGIQDANRQIKLANAEFKAAASGMDDWGKSADGVQAKIEQLKSVLSNQKTILESYKKQLELTAAEYGENSRQADDLRIKIANQQTAVNNTERSIRDYTTQLADLEREENSTEQAAENLSENIAETGTTAEKTSEGFSIFKGVLADLVASGIKLAISEFKNLVSAAKEAYEEFDSGRDAVITATGATGEAAKELTKSYAEVAKSVVGDFSVIGSALGEVNTRFGYTGEELEEATVKFMKFADITGSDAVQSVQLVARAMGDAGIDSSEYSSVLDDLAIAAQASGISVSKLTEMLTKYGAPMRALGLGTKDAIAIFSQWEKAGVNTEIAFSGMKTAISKWSKEGKDASVEFRKMLEEIGAAPDIAAATTKAIEVFGSKAGPDLADAIQGGRFEFEEFLQIVENSEGTVEKTFDQTKDATDRVKLGFQQMKVALGETTDSIIAEYSPQIEEAINKITPIIQNAITFVTSKIPPAIKKITDLVEKLKPIISGVFGWIVSHKTELIAALAGIGAAIVAWNIATVVTNIIKMVQALKAMGLMAAFTAAKQWLLNTALLANPIGLVVAAIAGLVAAFVVLWNTSEDFRNFWIGAWDSIKKAFFSFLDAWGVGVDEIKNSAKSAWENIKSTWKNVGEWFKNYVIKPVENFFVSMWDGLKTGAANAWDGIKSVFSHVSDWFSDVFSTAWQKVKDVFSTGGKVFDGIKEGIVDTFKNVVNAIIRGINKVVAIPFNAINDVLDKLQGIEVAGVQPFDGMFGHLPVPQIPELARGGVLKRGQVGLLEGNGAEAVVPLENNARWISATAAALKEALKADGIIGTGCDKSVVNNYSFVQNNTSPKALSRLDIYRQTHNLIMRGAT